MKTPSACPENDIREKIIDHLRRAEHRHTPRDLARAVASAYDLNSRAVHRAIKDLVAENRLTFTQHMGHTFLEISYKRPVEVGGGVILAPPEAHCRTAPDQILIRIAPGAAFGMGDHATTRIALQLMAWTFRTNRLPCRASEARVLDIGTGSGVLAIGACLMGAGAAVGVDTDACARAEAARNARLNRLEDRIRITEATSVFRDGFQVRPRFNRSFSLILANLRYPTLTRLCSQIQGACTAGAPMVLSGFRAEEQADLVDTWAREGFESRRSLAESGWCGIVLEKTP